MSSSPPNITPDELMDLAIAAARIGIALGQSPFGCAIATGNRVVAACHNTVWLDRDATAHAEINAVRQAGNVTGHPLLEEAMVATTCEPCPMCAAALHWTRAGSIYFGASIADADQAGFRELPIAAGDVLAVSPHAGRPLHLAGGVRVDECLSLFSEWKRRGGQAY